MTDHEASDREVRAYMALQGMAGGAGKLGDWRDALTNVLRSDAPLTPEFREALAKAIDGDLHGFRLELAAAQGLKKRRQDQWHGVQLRRRYVKIGSWIEARIAEGEASGEAISAAANLTETGGYKACEAALTYTRRFNAYLATLAPKNETERIAFEALFHTRDAEGLPLDQSPTPPEME